MSSSTRLPLGATTALDIGSGNGLLSSTSPPGASTAHPAISGSLCNFTRHHQRMEWTPPKPPLSTGTLMLRPFEHRDAPAVVKACTDERILRFTFMEEGTDDPQALEWIDRSNEWWPHGMPRFAITDATNDQVLGQIGIAVTAHHRSAEAYYWILAERRGQGVASAALGLVADWAFANGVERLYLLVHTDNEASNGLADRMGFAREGVLRAYEPFKGHRPDLVSWSLLPPDDRPWHQPS